MALFIGGGVLIGAMFISGSTEADDSAPDAVTNITITEHGYSIYFNKGIQYLKPGETYQLNGTGPTTSEDENLDHIEFIMAGGSGDLNEVVLRNFTRDEMRGKSSTRNYVLEFVAQKNYEYFYAVSYDKEGNSNKSEAVTGIVVDGRQPYKPTKLSFEHTGQDFIEVTGTVHDSVVKGAKSGMSHALLYVDKGEGAEVVRHESNGSYEWRGGEEYRIGDPMKVEVKGDNTFAATIYLEVVSTDNGDIRNTLQAQGVDNVGNVGDKSDASELLSIRMLNPQKSLDVEIKEMAFGLSDGVDQLKEMSITFLQFPPGDTGHHTMEMNYHLLSPLVDRSATAMVGYWTVTTDLSGDVKARVKIFFQHPSISAFDFNSLRLVTRAKMATNWSVIEDAIFVHQEANPAQGIPELYYVEATVTSFSDFGIVQGKPDLQISDTHIFANPLVGGQTVRISATVRNVGEFSGPAEDVTVRVYWADEEGAEFTIGWINFENPIESGKDNEQTGEVVWEAPIVCDVEKRIFYVWLRVDPNAEIAEYNELNNEVFMDEGGDGTIDPVEVLRVSYGGCPSFAMNLTMTIVATMVVAGTAVARYKPKKGKRW